MAFSELPALELVEVGKTYPGAHALKAVSLRLTAGEVHALVGENGAGKSTLVGVLGGIVQPDRGVIRLAGEVTTFPNPLAARKAGIAVIHQELSLLPQMTVAQNLLLGQEERISRYGLVRPKDRRHEARAVLDRMGLAVEPEAIVGSLPVSLQQLIEIARALSQNAKVVLMDEPTAALSEVESKTLFSKIGELKSFGVAILYVSHRIDEVMKLSDRVSVLRDGAMVESGPTSSFTAGKIITAMVGRTIAEHYPKRRAKEFGPDLLEVEVPTQLTENRVYVRCGEIIGLAGLIGSGRSEWACDLFSGLTKTPIRLRGIPISPKSARESRALGIGFVPGDRKTQGIFPDLSVGENLTITLLDKLSGRFGILNRNRRSALAASLIARLGIRCANDRARVGTLSGGNQQKVAMAKWLARDCDVLILDEPTRGVDIGAKEEIYRLIIKVADEGKAVILVSSELPELISLCDRIYVMRAGRFVAEAEAATTTQEQIISMASHGGASAA